MKQNRIFIHGDDVYDKLENDIFNIDVTLASMKYENVKKLHKYKKDLRQLIECVDELIMIIDNL